MVFMTQTVRCDRMTGVNAGLNFRWAAGALLEALIGPHPLRSGTNANAAIMSSNAGHPSCETSSHVRLRSGVQMRMCGAMSPGITAPSGLIVDVSDVTRPSTYDIDRMPMI